MSNPNECEHCLNYVYDDELGCNVCEAELDMDEVESVMFSPKPTCPYYHIDNEYKIVEKQN